jgi:hypothetical protein
MAYVYISGPYTALIKERVEENVQAAVAYGNAVASFGHTVCIPHLTHFWHDMFWHDYEFWMEQDLAWLAKCDVVFRMPGESKGADIEEEFAREHNIPVYFSVAEMFNDLNGVKE